MRTSRKPRAALRALAIAASALGGLALAVAAWVYGASERRIARRYDVPAIAPLPAGGDSAAARGRHLATDVMNCEVCHGPGLAGATYVSDAMATVAGPNLTRGRGGRGAALTDADFVRALRYGVHRDGTSMIVMPSEVFVHTSDDDVAALLAYVRRLPAVDREVPASRFGFAGRALLAAGKFNLLVASKTARVAWPASVPAAPTAAYGRYLANVAGCHGCHGYGLSGGRVAGPRASRRRRTSRRTRRAGSGDGARPTWCARCARAGGPAAHRSTSSCPGARSPG